LRAGRGRKICWPYSGDPRSDEAVTRRPVDRGTAGVARKVGSMPVRAYAEGSRLWSRAPRMMSAAGRGWSARRPFRLRCSSNCRQGTETVRAKILRRGPMRRRSDAGRSKRLRRVAGPSDLCATMPRHRISWGCSMRRQVRRSRDVEFARAKQVRGVDCGVSLRCSAPIRHHRPMSRATDDAVAIPARTMAWAGRTRAAIIRSQSGPRIHVV